ncbi:DNA topoisomerase IV subunit A [Hutsoniella sourekii]
MVKQINEHIEELSFTNVIGDRFGRYSKYIIQDRALPDIRDGLKPVQRRILFAMYKDRNTHDHPYRKSAKTVGNVIGNYHPHGDSSVYEAMVRMSQSWKNRMPLIDMHGNNGSMDGDPAAAMRYTEARLAPIASELLTDIDSETVEFGLNFDDTLEEPLVLPAGFPNLLVNGATGISAGYATDIPPHNLSEVIDATDYILSHDHYELSDLLQFVKGPDFPTGAIIQGAEDLEEVYRTGHGKVVVRSRTEIEKLRGGKHQIVATELPYEVNKSKLIQKIDDIRLQNKVEGIVEVRDESDINGVRLVIELKREADPEGILNYLLKNTDLQTNYNFNMVAIHNNRPVQASLGLMLEAYIQHRQEVVTRRTQHKLASDQARLHIVDGLIRMVSILDEVIATIRQSNSKQDAKDNLVARFDFSQDQAEAIVSLQLYRLTNTDIVKLQEERLELNENILHYQNILANKQILNQTIQQELQVIKKKYHSDRLTQVEAQVEAIEIDTSLLIPQEEMMVGVTKEGYIKRVSLRSYGSSEASEFGCRDLDYPLFIQSMDTHQALILITSKGNYIHLPVHEIPEARWKDLGTHLSQSYQLAEGEQMIAAFPALYGLDDQVNPDYSESMQVVLVTRLGMIKKTSLSEFVTYRSYKTRTAMAMKFKFDDDELLVAHLIKQDHPYEIGLVTQRSYSLRYSLDEVSNYGLRAQGVVAINLKEGDQLRLAGLIDLEASRPQMMVVSQHGLVKRFDSEIIGQAARASRGILLYKDRKNDPHRVLDGLALNEGSQDLAIMTESGQVARFSSTEVPITERLSNGNSLPALEGLGQVLAIYPDRLSQLAAAKAGK